MSQRQECLKEQMWKETHKPEFDKQIERLRHLENEIRGLPADSEQRASKQAIYDSESASAELFFLQFSP